MCRQKSSDFICKTAHEPAKTAQGSSRNDNEKMLTENKHAQK